MKRTALLAILLFFGISFGQAPEGAAELVAARQAELTRLAAVYGIHLTSGTWTHRVVSICPAFSHHVFAKYDQTVLGGEAASFLAIYSREMPPAKSLDRPWEGGISLLSLGGPQDLSSEPIAARRTTIKVYNRILAAEMRSSGHPDGLPTTTSELTDCYLHMAGEERGEQASGAFSGKAAVSHSLSASSELTRILSTGPGQAPRYASIQFNKDGSIRDAAVIPDTTAHP